MFNIEAGSASSEASVSLEAPAVIARHRLSIPVCNMANMCFSLGLGTIILGVLGFTVSFASSGLESMTPTMGFAMFGTICVCATFLTIGGVVSMFCNERQDG